MFEHIMVDLETLSTREDAAIISIGAVRFDWTEGAIGDEFYCVIDVNSYDNFKLRISADTVEWWMQQSPEARAVFFARDKEPLNVALLAFAHFVTTVENSILWGNGAAYDNIILRSAYRVCSLPYPVSYRNDMCFRTMLRVFRTLAPPIDAKLVRHNALDDAKAQARTLLGIMERLKELGNK